MIRKRHERQATQAGLKIFERDRSQLTPAFRECTRGRRVQELDRVNFEANSKVPCELFRILDAVGGRVLTRHRDTQNVLRTERLGEQRPDDGGIDTAAQADNRGLEAGELEVVLEPRDEAAREDFDLLGCFVFTVFRLGRFPRSRAFLALERDIDNTERGLEDRETPEEFPLAAHGEGRSVEEDLIVGADLIHINERDIEGLCSVGMNALAALAFSPLIGARGKRNQKLRSGFTVLVDGIFAIDSAPHHGVMGPKVLANSDGDLSAIAVPEFDFGSRLEVTAFVEDIVGRKQALGLAENNAAVLEDTRDVHRALALLGGIRRDVADGERAFLSLRGGCQFVDGAFVPFEHLGTLHQIVRRITADPELGRNKQTGLFGTGPLVRFFDLFNVCFEGPDDGVRLSHRDPHSCTLVS